MNDLTRAADHHILMSELERNKKMEDYEIDSEWYCPKCGLRRDVCDCGQRAQDEQTDEGIEE